jgi:FecR protein
MRLRRLIFCLPALLIGGANAFAAPGDTIGSAVTIVNLVTAQLNNDQHKLASGDDVHQQELIEVAADGHGDLMLRDDTKLALGPGARLRLDQFVYNPDISGGAIVLDLVRGAFRFITGVAAKPAYVIRTPTASITVRGTIFDVYVQESGVAWLLLIEGAVQVCAENGKCIVDDEPGKLISIGSDDVDKPVKWASLPQKRDVSFDNAFPFIVTAPEIDPKRHFTRDEIVLGTFPELPGKSGGDKADSDDDGGKKAGEDKPRHRSTMPERRRRVLKRRRRHHEDDASANKPNFPIGIGIGIGGFGHHGHHAGDGGKYK